LFWKVPVSMATI